MFWVSNWDISHWKPKVHCDLDEGNRGKWSDLFFAIALIIWRCLCWVAPSLFSSYVHILNPLVWMHPKFHHLTSIGTLSHAMSYQQKLHLCDLLFATLSPTDEAIVESPTWNKLCSPHFFNVKLTKFCLHCFFGTLVSSLVNCELLEGRLRIL